MYGYIAYVKAAVYTDSLCYIITYAYSVYNLRDIYNLYKTVCHIATYTVCTRFFMSRTNSATDDRSDSSDAGLIDSLARAPSLTKPPKKARAEAKGSAGMNKGEPAQVERIAAALGYAGSSVAIQVALKYTLTSLDFPSGLFIALSQCVFAVIALTTMKSMGKIDFPDPTMDNLRAVMPLPLIQVINVGCGLMGTKLVSIPMFTVLRRVSIPLTLAAEVYILSMPTTRNIVASVALLMFGSFVAALNDLSFNFLGYASVLISAVATCSYGTVSKMKLSGPRKRTKWELLYWNSLLSIPILFVAVSYKGGGFEAIANYEWWWSPSFMLGFAISTSMGFVLNFAILYNTQTNGPLSTTIVGSAKNVFTTYLGIFGFGGDYVFTITNFLGLNISMGGAILYSFVKFREKNKGKKSSSDSGTFGSGVSKV